MGRSRVSESSGVHDASDGASPIFAFATIADTTWRLFIPSIGLLLLGVYLDYSFGTKPWLMIIGLVVGVTLSVVLVVLQLRRKI
ncbi:MAG: AtpZ/AtpI family protein [Candidatus Saccharimonadaceae bacterium]